MERKSLFIGVTLGLICISVIAFLSNILTKVTHLKMNTTLQKSIEDTLATEATIDFSQVTDFEWDMMYVFTPYSSPNEILSQDDVLTLNNYFDIEHLDTIVMFGFVKNNKLVSYVELPIEYIADLPPTSIRFTNDTAVFQIQPAPPNSTVLNTIYLLQ